MDEPVIVNSNDNAIAEWVTANLKYLISVLLASNKQSFNLGEVAKQTTGANNSVGFYTDNDIGDNDANTVGSGNGVDGNCVGFGAKVGISGDLKERLVCLGAQLATTTIGLPSSQVHTAAPISPVVGRGHLTLASSVGWTVKPQVLLLRT